ncbi:MAG TPA: hypothetical protein VH092_27185 [Urbifossiella sp.]|jgi:hypothetical protein|nr:hypothetical protein [Urbifossiella sp.]
MTAIAKTLVFFTLVLGVGAAVFATAVYTQRPGWFSDPPDGPVAKGHVVISFKQLAKDIDSQGKAAAAAAGLWGKNLKELKAAEEVRTARVAEYAKLLNKGRTGAPAPGFHELSEDPVTGLLNVTEPGKAVLGPDGKALAGTETLLAQINGATDRIANELTPKISKHRADQKRLGAEIDIVAEKLARQRVIREDLQNEALYLAAASINISEQAETAGRRQKQLAARLRAFALQQ